MIVSRTATDLLSESRSLLLDLKFDQLKLKPDTYDTNWHVAQTQASYYEVLTLESQE